MDDVLIHYLEVNFADIAEQFAHAAAGEHPASEERAAAAERLRHLIRSLHQDRQETPALPHGGPRHTQPATIPAPRPTIHDTSLSPGERQVLEHFFDLFARSMERTGVERGSGNPPAPPVVAEVGLGRPQPEAVESIPSLPPPVSSPVEPATPPAAVPTVLLAAAQLALDLLQVDCAQVYTVTDAGRFSLRAAVPSESLAAPEPGTGQPEGLLARALEQTDVLSVEDLRSEAAGPQESAWLEAGFHGLAAIALSPPLERPIGVLVLLRRTPWRLDRTDAVRLEDLAVEVVTALRPNSLAGKVDEVSALQERVTLAREIHDGLASDLAAVVALFKYYEQRRERDPKAAQDLIPQLRSMSEEILASARDILRGLRPRTVHTEGLLPSSVRLIEEFGRTHAIETVVSLQGEETGLSPEQKDAIFQVLRESLSNVRKHAQAKTVWVGLDLQASPWVLTVRDDGRGFDPRVLGPDARRDGSYGLIGMRERAELLDATLQVTSRPGQGTAVTLTGPGSQP